MRNYTKKIKKRKIIRKKKNKSKKRGGASLEHANGSNRNRNRNHSMVHNFKYLYGKTQFYLKNRSEEKFGKVYVINAHGESIMHESKYSDLPHLTDGTFNWPVIYFSGTNCFTATNVGGWDCPQMNSSIRYNMKILLGITPIMIEVDNMYLPNNSLENYMLTSARSLILKNTEFNEHRNCSGILDCGDAILLGSGNDLLDGNINPTNISKIEIKGRIKNHVDGHQLTLNDALHLIQTDFNDYCRLNSKYKNNTACIVFVVHCREKQGFEKSFESGLAEQIITNNNMIRALQGESQPKMTFNFDSNDERLQIND
jgi:hypothetical protein